MYNLEDIKRAFTTVLDLAEGNVITKEVADNSPELRVEQEWQNYAITLVQTVADSLEPALPDAYSKACRKHVVPDDVSITNAIGNRLRIAWTTPEPNIKETVLFYLFRVGDELYAEYHTAEFPIAVLD